MSKEQPKHNSDSDVQLPEGGLFSDLEGLPPDVAERPSGSSLSPDMPSSAKHSGPDQVSREPAPTKQPPPTAQQPPMGQSPAGKAQPAAVPPAGRSKQSGQPPKRPVSGEKEPRPVQPTMDAAPVGPHSTAAGRAVGPPPTPSAGQPVGKGPVVLRPVILGKTTTEPSVPPVLAASRPEDEQEEELTERAARVAPPWLISAAFHGLLITILGLLFLPPMIRRNIELETVWAERLGDQLEFDSLLAGTAAELVQEPVITPMDLPEVPDPFAAPPKIETIVPDGVTSTSDIPSAQIGLALTGREPGMKRALLAAYGGTATTEAAVAWGLEWLARNQLRDGSWSLKGPYSNGAISENRPAATAMALIAFQGAGNTHRRGKFKENVKRGWDWLLKVQDAEGCFFSPGSDYRHRFYTHSQCTIALCELYGMTKDPALKEPAKRAIEYLIKSQSPLGGWRYSPQGDSDVSVTGWAVMALQSARMGYLPVPQQVLDRVNQFLDTVATENGSRYSYQRGEQPTKVMTAEALLCRQYLGWRRDDPRLIAGVEFLTRPDNLVNYNEPNVYYWYYASQVCHHMGGEYWRRWNEVMRQEIPAHQVKTGKEAGSWDPHRPRPDEWGDHGGRLYVTCLSIYCLEVYYRHLPLYSKVPFAAVGLPPSED